MKIKKILLLLITSLLIISCGKDVVTDESLDVNEKGWNVNEKFNISVNITDTLSSYNFYVNLRNTTDFKYSNFFFFVNTTFPNGKIARDTLECMLANQEGKWIGKGHGKIKDNRILFKAHVLFPMKGTYKFAIEHGMRDLNIAGIKNIGLRIVKNKNK